MLINTVMTHSQQLRRRLGAAALLVAALVTSSACSGDDQPGPAAAATPSGEPKTLDGAKAAAQTVFDRFSGGDFGGAWELYTAAGKAAITRADYIKLNETCARHGLPIELTSARLDGPGKAVVIARQKGAAQSYTMRYEHNAWKLAPAKQGLALYAKGADKAIALQKKAGTC
ncbi:hypothetical protein GCM10010435_03630 [Winogradskya consettensis]|uniref:Lipoprotein n=2 Tax=Winogradskya consettensis TaxID=113560 RepID=A0A919T1Y9_9ACTN|nr:hypothetical protein Aco04nite_78640 [Actinoplanes consettensis]